MILWESKSLVSKRTRNGRRRLITSCLFERLFYSFWVSFECVLEWILGI
jgi:hypothetical protein